MAPLPASAQAGACSPSLPSGDTVSNSLFGAMLPNLNKNWAGAAAKSIDPFQFMVDDHGISCKSDYNTACFFYSGYDNCEHAWVNVHVEDIVGLGALQFANLAVTSMNQKDVALHASRGPDGGKITDNVFAPEGADWNDTNYAILLPKVGADYAVTIDLGSILSICGNGFQCKSAPLFQGDKNVYQVDYSTDNVSWKSVGQVPSVSGSGLRSRTVPQGTSSNPSPNFNARYVRVYATSGDGNYSVSELRLYDTSSNIVSAGKRASGPNPVQLTDGIFAPEGAAWNDRDYAIILPKEGPAHALVVDLGKVVTVCNNGFDCVSPPRVQADKNEYQVDYSVDGINWSTAGKLPTVSDSGLRTRALPQGSSQDDHPANFPARYVRIWASSGDGNYSVSEMQIFASGGPEISLHAPTFGPEPYVSNGETAPDGGTDWNDGRYATVLPPCTTASNSQCLPGAKTAPVIVDLGASFPIAELVLQADRHAFQVDISSDASSWTPLWPVPSDSTSGLSTRRSGALTGSPTGRYLRVYGTAGDDNNYSVANLSALTGAARTACAYDSAANVGEAFACNYDGQFATELVPDANGGIPITFAVTLVEAKASCNSPPFPGSSTITLDHNGTRQSCSATLKVTPASADSTAAGGFCSGVCGTSGGPSAVMSYMQLSGLAFEVTDMVCSPGIDSDLQQAVIGTVAAETAGAVRGLFDTLFEATDAGPKYFIPFPASCAPAPVDATELATGLDTLFSLEIPADAWKNDGNRNAAMAIVGNVRRALESGRTQPAVQQLGNLRGRFDKCGAQSDWLGDCAYQARIRDAIDAILQRLAKPALARVR